MAPTYHGLVQSGQIQLQENVELPEGTEVLVIVVSDPDTGAVAGFTGQQLLDSALVGMWSDRDDITSAASFSEQLRKNAQRREIPKMNV